MTMIAPPDYFRMKGAGFDQHVRENGYAWWYADALSDDGQHGITVIAFIGSVFSPYYKWARRKGLADPLNHCALNVALYGRRHRWAMTERPKANVTRTASTLSIGPSDLSWDGSTLTIRIDEVTAPIPSRIRGTVRIRPSAVTSAAFVLNADGNHRWWPIAPTSRVEVTLSDPALRWQGDGYLDMNIGDLPLDTGFTDWQWSRAAVRDGTAINYDAECRDGSRTNLSLTFDPSGTMQSFHPPPPTILSCTKWRMRRSARSEPSPSAHVVKTLEDAPFYTRSIVSGKLFDRDVTMMHESLSLDKFRRPIVQAMLPFRMPRARA